MMTVMMKITIHLYVFGKFLTKSSVSWTLFSFLISFSIHTGLVVPLKAEYAWMSISMEDTVHDIVDPEPMKPPRVPEKIHVPKWRRHHRSMCIHHLPCLFGTACRVSCAANPTVYSKRPTDICGMSGSWTIQNTDPVERNSCHHTMGMFKLCKTV